MSDGIEVRQTGSGAWHLNPKIHPLWRQMEGQWLLFEVLSGQTHQMDPLTAAALMCFESGAALTTESLHDRMLTEFGIDLRDVGAGAAHRLLAQFGTLGLVVPAGAPARLHAAV